MTNSPYEGKNVAEWTRITNRLIRKHPLSKEEIVEVTLASWKSIFASRLGTKGFRIGRDIFPKPQIMGFLLHELIPLEFSARYPADWRIEESAADKDLVHIKKSEFSIEIKTSSHPRNIYGNRSYAQATTQPKKVKSGYYLAVNFEKFTKETPKPQISLIRFGWLDAGDWVGQKAASGQQSRLSRDVETKKLLILYCKT